MTTDNTRRAQGDGTVFQLPDGRWRAQIDMGWIDGKRVRPTKTDAKRSVVVAWLREKLRERDRGQLVAKSPTLSDWFATYLREVASPRVAPSTLANYRRDFAKHIEPTLGRKKLDKLEPTELSRLYTAKIADGLSPTTVLLLHATLRRALNVAMRYGLVGRNVALMVEPPKKKQTEITPLSATEARQLLEAACDDRMEARWLVGLSLGLRQGEVLGLWWEDIDLTAGSLRVTRQFARSRDLGQPRAFAPLKSARSRRVLALPKPLIAALKAHREKQDEERDLVGDAWADERIVFTTPIGTPIDHSADARAFKALLKKAKVRPTRLHDLRHTAATLLLAQGVPARIVMELLGHSQIGLTLNTYSHVSPTMLGEAASSMESALWGDDEDEEKTDDEDDEDPPTGVLAPTG